MPKRSVPAPPDDYLYRSRIRYQQNRQEMWFDVGEGLFSAANIDAGTAFLLRWLGGQEFDDIASVLDLGCGYGPIGTALARFRDDRRVVGVDSDALAVEYTAWNASLNRVGSRVAAQAGVGYTDLAPGQTFDLVTSNIPAKIGPEALQHFLYGGASRLTSHGRVAVVVVDRLRVQVEEYLKLGRASMIDRHDNRGYAVFVYRPAMNGDRDQAGDPYGRGEQETFSFGRVKWRVRPTYTLPEFDTLSYGTQEALKLIQGGLDDYVVAGVGHGHVAAFLLGVAPSARIQLVDRDLLALRVAVDTVERNVGLDAIAERVRSLHTARPAEAPRTAGDCVILRLERRQPVRVATEVLHRVLEGCRRRSSVLAYGRAADVSRSLEAVRRRGTRVTVAAESRSRGHAALLLVLPK